MSKDKFNKLLSESLDEMFGFNKNKDSKNTVWMGPNKDIKTLGQPNKRFSELRKYLDTKPLYDGISKIFDYLEDDNLEEQITLLKENGFKVTKEDLMKMIVEHVNYLMSEQLHEKNLDWD